MKMDLVIGGDMNIDRCKSNNPENRKDGIRVIIRVINMAASCVDAMDDTSMPIPTVVNTYTNEAKNSSGKLPAMGISNQTKPTRITISISRKAITA